MEQTTGIRGDARAEWLTTNRDAAKVLDQYIQLAEREFISRVRGAGLNVSGDLLASFKHDAAVIGEGYVSARLEMAGYGRIKDLRRLTYSRTPPLLAMENYVERVGTGKFIHVPGYPEGRFPRTESKAVERIAWAMKMKFRRMPNQVRGYRGIYSDPLLKDVLPYLFQDLATACNLTASRAFKVAFLD